MASVLIVYATRRGQTAKIASHIAETIRSRGHEVELVDAGRMPRDLTLERFAAVCIGGPILGGTYPRSVERFVRAHRAELDRVPSYFFSVGLAVASRTTDGRAETQRCVDDFVRRTGWRPGHLELFAGASPYTRYNFFIRFVMRRIAAEAGGETDTSRDYEYTDWNAVARFGLAIADSVESAAAQRADAELARGATPRVSAP